MSDPFKRIYQLAKRRKKDRLAEFLARDNAVDVHHGIFTPCGKLASEGDMDSAQWLLDHFHASLSGAVLGCAYAGNKPYVDYLLDQGASLDSALTGYAYGGWNDIINVYIKSYLAKLDAILSLEFVIENNSMSLASKEPFKSDDLCHLHSAWTNPTAITIGNYYANNISREPALFNTDLANNIYIKSDIKQTILAIHQPTYLAVANHTTWEKQAASQDQDLNETAYGFALAGNHERVNHLRKNGANLEKILEAYAEGGHVLQVNQLIAEGVNPDLARRGYHKGEHLQQIAKLNHVTKKKSLEIPNFGPWNSLLTPQAQLRFLAFFDDPKLREQCAKKINKHLDRMTGTAHLSKACLLLSTSAHQNYSMKEYNLGYTCAMMWLNASIKTWFLQGHQLVIRKELTSSQFFLISSYIFSVNKDQLMELCGMEFKTHRTGVVKDLKKYGESKFAFFKKHYSDSKTLITKCANSASREEMVRSLEDEKATLKSAKEDGYSEIINRRLERMTDLSSDKPDISRKYSSYGP